jgi:alpha-tubulin suppressor-like RCC1 family protein
LVGGKVERRGDLLCQTAERRGLGLFPGIRGQGEQRTQTVVVVDKTEPEQKPVELAERPAGARAKVQVLQEGLVGVGPRVVARHGCDLRGADPQQIGRRALKAPRRPRRQCAAVRCIRWGRAACAAAGRAGKRRRRAVQARPALAERTFDGHARERVYFGRRPGRPSVQTAMMRAMDRSSKLALLDLPFELLTSVCQQLNLRDLVRLAQTCKHFRRDDGGMETVELPTKLPVINALRDLAFPRQELIPSTRPIDCSESWVAYLSRLALQRLLPEEAPTIAAGSSHSLMVDAAGRLLACGRGGQVGHGAHGIYFEPTAVTATASVPVRSVVAGHYSLALSWDGRVYSWGFSSMGQLGHGDRLGRNAPVLVEGLDGVRGIAVGSGFSLAVTQSGVVFSWGCALLPEAEDSLRPIIVEGLEGVRIRGVFAGGSTAFAVSEDGELFSWGEGFRGLPGHGDEQNQSSPKLRGVRIRSVSVGLRHALALTKDGLVYAWGETCERPLSGSSRPRVELLPTPVEALLGVRMRSIAAAGKRSYAVADTGELWAWGVNNSVFPPLGHGEQMNCPVPKPIEALQGIKVHAVAAGLCHALARADDGSVYAWGDEHAAEWGALGLGSSGSDARRALPTPQRVPGSCSQYVVGHRLGAREL